MLGPFFRWHGIGLAQERGFGIIIQLVVFLIAFLVLLSIARIVRRFAERGLNRLPTISKLLRNFILTVVYWVTARSTCSVVPGWPQMTIGMSIGGLQGQRRKLSTKKGFLFHSRSGMCTSFLWRPEGRHHNMQHGTKLIEHRRMLMGLAALGLTGCTAGEDFSSPTMKLSNTFLGKSNGPA